MIWSHFESETTSLTQTRLQLDFFIVFIYLDHLGFIDIKMCFQERSTQEGHRKFKKYIIAVP